MWHSVSSSLDDVEVVDVSLNDVDDDDGNRFRWHYDDVVAGDDYYYPRKAAVALIVGVVDQ